MTDDETQFGLRAHALGVICFQWSYIEYLVANAVWYAMDLDKKRGMIVTGGLNLNALMALGIELLSERGDSEDLLAELLRLRSALNSAEGLQFRRNLLVHGIYSSRVGDATVMIELHRKQRLREKAPVTLAYFEETLTMLSDEIAKLVPVWQRCGVNAD